MTEMQVYWWLMLDNISFVGGFIGCIVGGVSTFGIIGITVSAITGEMSTKYLVTWYIYVPLIILCILTAFIPNSRQYAMVKVFPKIANNEVVREIPDDMIDMYSVAKKYMKRMLKEE